MKVTSSLGFRRRAVRARGWAHASQVESKYCSGQQDTAAALLSSPSARWAGPSAPCSPPRCRKLLLSGTDPATRPPEPLLQRTTQPAKLPGPTTLLQQQPQGSERSCVFGSSQEEGISVSSLVGDGHEET